MQAWMKIALASIFFLVGCSLQMEEPRDSVALFVVRSTVPGDEVNNPVDDPQVISSADFQNMRAYPYVCMQVIGADGKFGTPVQEMGSEQTSGSVTALFSKFTIPKLWVGRKYSIRVFGFKNRTEVCPFDFKGVSDFAQLGVLDTFVVPDKPSEVIIPVNFVESSGINPCTGDLYSNPVSPGTVCLGPESQQIEFVATNTGFPIWREQGGQRRILNATGIVGNGWQKKFNSNEELTDTAVINSIAGRVCPDKIANPDGTPGTGCLYYDQGHVPQALNTSSGPTGAPGIDYLESWNISISGGGEEAAFFEGNIATCNSRGMRLPVIYETDITDIPDNDSLPNSAPEVWDTIKSGVPSVDGSYTWTATARRDPVEASNHKHYFTWRSRIYSTAPYDEANSSQRPAVRCVLPAFY